MNTIKNQNRVGKTSNSTLVNSKDSSNETTAAPTQPSPFPSPVSDSPIEQTFQVTSHRVEYVKPKTPLDTPTVQQLLAIKASKSKEHEHLLAFMRKTKNPALEHRLASILLSKDNPSLAKRIKDSGIEYYSKKKIAPAA